MPTTRSYDGTDDSTTFSGYANRSGPVTYAALLKRVSASDIKGIVFGYTSGGTAQHGLMLLDESTGEIAFGATSTSSENSTITFQAADGWGIAVASHPGGSGTARLHLWLEGTGTWEHQEGSSSITIGSTGASGTLRIGCAAAADFFFEGNIAVVAAWSKELSDSEVAALSVNKATQDWYDVDPASLLFLADFNQASVATAITDLSGNGLTESAETGTAADTTVFPTVWTYGVTAAEPQIILPDADTTTTGWTTTPLYSKINDSSDGTVITGALS